MKKLFKIINRLTATELKILLNYLLFMSNDKNEYTLAVLSLTRLFTGRYKTFCEQLQATPQKTLKFILQGLKFTKNIIMEVLKND